MTPNAQLLVGANDATEPAVETAPGIEVDPRVTVKHEVVTVVALIGSLNVARITVLPPSPVAEEAKDVPLTASPPEPPDPPGFEELGELEDDGMK